MVNLLISRKVYFYAIVDGNSSLHATGMIGLCTKSVYKDGTLLDDLVVSIQISFLFETQCQL